MATQGKLQYMRIINGVIYFQNEESLRKRKEIATELYNSVDIQEGGKLILGKGADALIRELDQHPHADVEEKVNVTEATDGLENDGVDDVTYASFFDAQDCSPQSHDDSNDNSNDCSMSYFPGGSDFKPRVDKDCVSSSVSNMDYEETPAKSGKKTKSSNDGSGQRDKKMLWCKQNGCETYHPGIKRLRQHVTKKHPKVDASRITEFNYVTYDNLICSGELPDDHLRRPMAKPKPANKKFNRGRRQQKRAKSPIKSSPEEEKSFWCKQKGCNLYIQGITQLRKHVAKSHRKVDPSRITQWNYATFDCLLAQTPTVPVSDQ
ncbi:hypothetical protein Ocin01_11013 [Orchesella cincta]|uniref:C2H2-type domain-containing protein n=1 Tax=Orchesella cincta TaxID=48709 RepID=A0A1D2MRJ0_ORCCI|nr:hypothetical protein Ocin01_11013 [Orchesella cincta]